MPDLCYYIITERKGDKKMRDDLLNRMIKLYGFENPIVIQFAQLCESYEENEWCDKMLYLLVEAHESDPVRDDE